MLFRSDTVAVMNKGRIEQLGAPEVLYELPKTVFVANFLGQSNLFAGEVVSTTADAITVSLDGGAVVVPKARASSETPTVVWRCAMYSRMLSANSTA